MAYRSIYRKKAPGGVKPKYSRNMQMNSNTTNFWKNSLNDSRDNLDKSLAEMNIEQMDKIHMSDQERSLENNEFLTINSGLNISIDSMKQKLKLKS